jgi:hypothetical protein
VLAGAFHVTFIKYTVSAVGPIVSNQFYLLRCPRSTLLIRC